MALTNYYYSGQGSLMAAVRDAVTGKPKGFERIGNVPELSIDIEVTNFEHKESETGARGLDLIINKERKGKFTFKMESITLDNLALGLMGTSAAVAGAPVSDEPHKVYLGKRVPLAHPDVSAVTVTVGVTPMILGTDYTLDLKNGVIIWPAVATANAVENADVVVDYTYGGYNRLDAFTQSSANERYLRFEGLNTVDDSLVIVDMYRCQFDPLTGYGLINEELASVDVSGSLLSDPFITTPGASKFFIQRNFTA
jgi:hypothetical protein